MRNLIYAFDRSFEGAIGALGAPLVGMAAEKWFGFNGVAGGDQACAEHSTANMGECVCRVVVVVVVGRSTGGPRAGCMCQPEWAWCIPAILDGACPAFPDR
jgi:hypothetical protein